MHEQERENADIALAQGDVGEAIRLYSEILLSYDEPLDPHVVRVYCNRSLAFYKTGKYEEALQDACMAMDLLAEETDDGGLLAKVYHRKAQALIAKGDKVKGLHVYRDGLKRCGESDSLRAATMIVLQNEMPDSWIVEYWVEKVGRCEAAHPLSARDGILLKRVPASKKMEREEMTRCMLALLDSDIVFSWACRELIVSLWESSGGLRRSCAYIRGAVYAHAGNYEQGEKDATVALVYGGGAAAYALRSQCFEHRGENVKAVLDILRAIEDDDETNSNAEEQYSLSLSRLLPRVPDHYARAIENGCGYAGLKRMIDIEQERLQPEFKKQRPKYYYYYEWMKKRIHERHPAISGGVMDKLLTLDATELDLLLQYPQAIDGTVARLERVLEEKGEKDLEECEIPLLSWEEVEEYKKQQVVGKDGSLESSQKHQIEAN